MSHDPARVAGRSRGSSKPQRLARGNSELTAVPPLTDDIGLPRAAGSGKGDEGLLDVGTTQTVS